MTSMPYLVLVEEGDLCDRLDFRCPVYSRQYFESKKAQNIRCVLMKTDVENPVYEDCVLIEDFYPEVST